MLFKNLKIIDNSKYKICKSVDYNFIFNKDNGFFLRWGKNKEDDPAYAPFPEILDLEISTGKCNGRCSFCYKGNGEDKNTHHMTLNEFKTIFHKMPNLTQIAFGICDVDSNPDFFPMMQYAKKNGVIPNYTCNGLKITPTIAKKTAKICGAVAVSIVNKEKSFNAIKTFIKAGMRYVNCHYMLSNETYEDAFQIINKLSEIKDFNAAL